MPPFLLAIVVPSAEEAEEEVCSPERECVGVREEERRSVEECPQVNSRGRLLQTGRKGPWEV